MVWLPGDKPQNVTVVYKEVNQAGPGELEGKTGDQEKLRKAARDEAESRKEERLLGQVMSTISTSGMRYTQHTERHTLFAPSCACIYTQGPPSH